MRSPSTLATHLRQWGKPYTRTREMPCGASFPLISVKKLLPDGQQTSGILVQKPKSKNKALLYMRKGHTRNMAKPDTSTRSKDGLRNTFAKNRVNPGFSFQTEGGGLKCYCLILRYKVN